MPNFHIHNYFLGVIPEPPSGRGQSLLQPPSRPNRGTKRLVPITASNDIIAPFSQSTYVAVENNTSKQCTKTCVTCNIHRVMLR